MGGLSVESMNIVSFISLLMDSQLACLEDLQYSQSYHVDVAQTLFEKATHMAQELEVIDR